MEIREVPPANGADIRVTKKNGVKESHLLGLKPLAFRRGGPPGLRRTVESLQRPGEDGGFGKVNRFAEGCEALAGAPDLLRRPDSRVLVALDADDIEGKVSGGIRNLRE